MRTLTAMLLALSCEAAFAQDSIYIGIGLGDFEYREPTSDALVGTISGSATAKKLFGGFEFNDHVALEISYNKTDTLRHENSDNVPPFGDVDYTLQLKFDSTSLRAMGQLPLDWGVLLGGLGYFSSSTDYNETAMAACCGTASSSGSFDDDGLTAALGIEWRFGRFGTRYAVRLEYEWWDLDDADGETIGLGFSYGF